MRVRNTQAFWKLAEEHILRNTKGTCFFLVHPQDKERTRLKELFLRQSFVKGFGESKSYEKIETLFSDLEWCPLLGERVLFILDGVHKLKKEHVEHLAKKNRTFPGAILFLLSELPSSSLFSELESRSLTLDLFEEKSWEKKKRIEEQIAEEVRKKALHFTPDALRVFLEALAPDYLGWEEEVEKLSIYKGDAKVTLQDLEELFDPIQEAQFLQNNAQQFLKTGSFTLDASFEDTQRWLQWIGTLRSTMETCMGFMTGENSVKSRYLADIYESIARGWTVASLQKAWLVLFDFEKRLKLFQASPQLLWQHTLAKIDFLRYAP